LHHTIQQVGAWTEHKSDTQIATGLSAVTPPYVEALIALIHNCNLSSGVLVAAAKRIPMHTLAVVAASNKLQVK
jgi:hypothetical protein